MNKGCYKLHSVRSMIWTDSKTLKCGNPISVVEAYQIPTLTLYLPSMSSLWAVKFIRTLWLKSSYFPATNTSRTEFAMWQYELRCSSSLFTCADATRCCSRQPVTVLAPRLTVFYETWFWMTDWAIRTLLEYCSCRMSTQLQLRLITARQIWTPASTNSLLKWRVSFPKYRKWSFQRCNRCHAKLESVIWR